MSSGTQQKVLLTRIKKVFNDHLPQNCDNLLDECTSPLRCCLISQTHRTLGARLCQNYDLSAEQLFWKWETVRHLSRGTHHLDASSIEELKICIAQEHVKLSKPTNKGSSARLSGVMSGRSGAPGYGPGRIPRQLDGGFMSGVKREDVDRPVPVAGSSKISFSQVGKVERRECKRLTRKCDMY